MRYRKPNPQEMDVIYLMGLDAWGEGGEKASYLESCKNSKKYELGQWYCLEIDGELAASLIIYRDEWGLKPGYIGIGSVCTAPSHRRKGYATALVVECIKDFKASGAQGIYLFSDIAPEIYQRLGFELVNGHESDGMMFLGFSGALQTVQPSYF
ncbi:GNAT family N-acetyltransferase [Gynuella sunshinyii]|uniref:Putative acetyltransferase n=1 Tax=Gynuella sunshinyii YC6258 TaxID=1445510 RepID=A0A0C5VQJ9_9GAMM|nr:GNAT family N-acetyltransferase [Gynuella sunshinyii]AJQ95683.1 putative acetyltransferase [Gynuella sunshinyii YC6258]